MSSKFRIIATALIGLLLVVGTLGAMAANQRALARPLGQSGGHLIECYVSRAYGDFYGVEVYTELLSGGVPVDWYTLAECSSCSYVSATVPNDSDDFRFGCAFYFEESDYCSGGDCDYWHPDSSLYFDNAYSTNRWQEYLGDHRWSDGASDWVHFFLGEPPRTLSLDTIGDGNVTLNPVQYPAGYLSGTQVTLNAQPDSGWYFSSWSGDLSGSDDSVSITMDTSKSVVATFETTSTPTPTPSPTPDPSSPEDWLVFPNCEFDLANANSGSCSVYPGASSIEASWLQDTDWPEVRDYTAYITQSGTISSFEVCLAGSGYSDWYGGDLAEPTVGFDGACSDYSVYQSGSCFEYIHDTSNFTGACRITSLSANEVRGNKSECSDDNCSIELWWYFSAINEQPIQAFSPEPPPWMPTATPTPVPATVTPNPTPFPTPEQPYNPGFPASGWYTDDKGAGKTRAPKIPRESPAPWFKAPKLRPPKFPKVISFPVLPDLPPPSLQPITLDVVGEGKGWNKRLAPKFDPLTLPHINDWQAPEMNPMSLPVAPVLQPLTLPTGGAYTLHKLPKLKSPKIPTTMTFSKMPKLLSDKIPTSSNFLSVPEVITLPGSSAKGRGKTLAEKYQPVITRVKTLATKTKEFGKPSTIKVRGKTAVSMSQEFSVGFMEATDYLRAVADLEVIGPSVAAVLLGLGWIFLIMVAKLHIKAISTIVDLAIRFMDFVAELVPM
jgi:hypothetical protein